MDETEFVSLMGRDGGKKWTESTIPEPVINYCTNANKATGTDQACVDEGNSAWNTHSSSITADPEKAMLAPYPDRKDVGVKPVYKVQGEVYTV